MDPSSEPTRSGDPDLTPLPPPPPGVRYVRPPFLGLIVADDALRERVDGLFSRPMIILALMVLPLLALEYLVRRPPMYSFWWWSNIVAFSVIWLAFVVEFIVKISIAECRIEYCKRNWLDIVIILVPILRPFRAASIVRTTKVFTLRGVGMRVLRAMIALLLGLEATDRMLQRLGLKKNDKRKPPQEMTRAQLMDEVGDLRRKTDAWSHWYGDHESFIEEHGYGYVPPQRRPAPDETICFDVDDHEGDENSGEAATTG